MRAGLLKASALIWAMFGAYWLVSAARSRNQSAKPTRSEPAIYRPLRISLLIFSFTLLFWKRTAFGILGARFAPASAALVWTGFSLFLAGLGIAIWARVHLGQYWSDKVMLQADHRLICSGPYSHMRHPIYSGVLLGIGSTALILGEWRGLLAFVLMLLNYSIKALREERILSAQFGTQFEQHKKHAGFLLPRF
jgi:protein-S-isoprenylcysteine O-methyltransferase Ste14